MKKLLVNIVLYCLVWFLVISGVYYGLYEGGWSTILDSLLESRSPENLFHTIIAIPVSLFFLALIIGFILLMKYLVKIIDNEIPVSTTWALGLFFTFFLPMSFIMQMEVIFFSADPYALTESDGKIVISSVILYILLNLYIVKTKKR